MSQIWNQFMHEGAMKQLFKVQTREVQKKYNLKKIDMQILDFLMKSGDNNTAKDIQYALKLNKGHISQALDGLIEEQYVKSITDERDKRVMHYILEKKSEPIVEDLKVSIENTRRRIMEGVTEDERKVLRRVSKKMWKNLNDILEDK